jgi:septal ring factor EnvC (AmiA/AmiB activator)
MLMFQVFGTKRDVLAAIETLGLSLGGQLNELRKDIKYIMATIQDLQNAEDAEKAAIASAITLIQKLQAQITASPIVTQAQMDAVTAEASANVDALNAILNPPAPAPTSQATPAPTT